MTQSPTLPHLALNLHAHVCTLAPGQGSAMYQNAVCSTYRGSSCWNCACAYAALLCTLFYLSN